MAGRHTLLLAASFVAICALCAAVLVLPGRVGICVENAGSSTLSAVVSVPNTSLRFRDIARNSQQCQAVRIVQDGSLDFQTTGAVKGLDYVHADMGGDLRVRYRDGVASLDGQRS